MGGLAAVSSADRRAAVLAGMAGAAMPDLDKPGKLWFGRSPWPPAVDRFHMGIQDEAAHRLYVELLATAGFAAAALVALRGRGAGRLPG